MWFRHELNDASAAHDLLRRNCYNLRQIKDAGFDLAEESGQNRQLDEAGGRKLLRGVVAAERKLTRRTKIDCGRTGKAQKGG